MLDALRWIGFALIPIGLLAFAGYAYSRHAKRAQLAGLALGTSCMSVLVGLMGVLALMTGLGRSGDWPYLVTGSILTTVGVLVPALLVAVFRRMSTPLGGLRVAPGDALPALPTHALDGTDVDASTLRGPHGTLLVWYRGLT